MFDAADVLLETHAVPGISNGNNNNSAIFIGITRPTADIDHVEFSVNQPATPDDFAINRVDLIAGGASVPEPGTLALLGIALLGGLLAGRKRRP